MFDAGITSTGIGFIGSVGGNPYSKTFSGVAYPGITSTETGVIGSVAGKPYSRTFDGPATGAIVSPTDANSAAPPSNPADGAALPKIAPGVVAAPVPPNHSARSKTKSESESSGRSGNWFDLLRDASLADKPTETGFPALEACCF